MLPFFRFANPAKLETGLNPSIGSSETPVPEMCWSCRAKTGLARVRIANIPINNRMDDRKYGEYGKRKPRRSVIWTFLGQSGTEGEEQLALSFVGLSGRSVLPG
jgi:hypothetical protein